VDRIGSFKLYIRFKVREFTDSVAYMCATEGGSPIRFKLLREIVWALAKAVYQRVRGRGGPNGDILIIEARGLFQFRVRLYLLYDTYTRKEIKDGC
jgi:hypothetical protein